MMIGKKVVLLVSLIFLFYMDFSHAVGPGSTSGITLLQPSSARTSPFSDACVALEGNSDLLNCNPSSIHSIKNFSGSLFYKSGLADDYFTNLHLGKKFDSGVFGGSLYYYDTGKIDAVDLLGNTISKVGKRDLIFSIASARKLGAFPLGINLKFITTEIFGQKASAYAVDLGGQYKISDAFNVGLSGNNLGTNLKYVKEKESLPSLTRAGLNYKTNIKKVSFQVSNALGYYLNEEESLYSIGGEMSYLEAYFVRLGYLTNLSQSSDDSLSIGGGLKFKNYQIDYAARIVEDLDMLQNVSIGFEF